MLRAFVKVASALTVALVALVSAGSVASAAGKSYTLVVSNYSGWIPWYYAEDTGILRKWAAKYNVTIDVKKMTYTDSIEAYRSGGADAVTVTNMEALNLLSADKDKGVDTSVVVMGDYSNGNDAVLTRRISNVADLRGKDVLLVKGTVSQYLLSRALQTAGLKESDVNLVDESDDTKIADRFNNDPNQKIVVTWNPMVMQIQKNIGIRNVFDSSKIPGEIQDLLVIKTDVVNADPNFARALTGAWYEVMGILSQHGQVSEDAIAKMADLAAVAGGAPVPVAEFKGQLRKTALYLKAQDAVDYTRSDDLITKTDLVRKFSFDHGLLGSAASMDSVGIIFPNGTVRGDSKNIKLRYNSTFMEEAARNKL